MTEKSKLLIDADNEFLRTQNRASVQSRIASETEIAEQLRDAKTARLKAMRLEKAAMDAATPTSGRGKR
jgi:hypothetical protein